MRMVAKAIDGNSGTLAYNFFPQFGDMVLDSADNFYSNLQNNSKSSSIHSSFPATRK
jgi:hypothetical protein